MITPMEIQNHEFSQKWKGFSQEEVRHFLYATAEEFENLIEQNHKMATQLSIMRERLKDLESRDKVLKDTLISAQQIKTDIRDTANKEAQLILKEAQLKADAMFEDAKSQMDDIRHQIADLRRVRNDLLAETEMMVARFAHFVEAERQLSEEADKLHSFSVRRQASEPKATRDKTEKETEELHQLLKPQKAPRPARRVNHP